MDYDNIFNNAFLVIVLSSRNNCIFKKLRTFLVMLLTGRKTNKQGKNGLALASVITKSEGHTIVFLVAYDIATSQTH